MPNPRFLFPGHTRSRQQQQAAEAISPDACSPSHPGKHSLWCDLIVVEGGCYPLLASGVVAVITERKVFLRVAATAFTFTVHLEDVVQVRHVVPQQAVELHVRVPAAPAKGSASRQATQAPQQRLYRLEVTEDGTDLAEHFFRAVAAVLPTSSSSPSLRRVVAHEVFTDDAVTAYVGDTPRSMLPPHLLHTTGLQEVGWVERDEASAVTAPSPPAAAAHSPSPQPQQHQQQKFGNIIASPSSTTGHLRKIYVAPAPAFWRLDPPPQRWTVTGVPSRLPQATAAAVSTSHRPQRPPTTVAMSSRESSRMADLCGLRPLATHAFDPRLAASSNSARSIDRSLHVQYGPTTSG